MGAMTIPFLDYKQLYSRYQPGVDDAMQQALVCGHLILQEDVEEFERRFAEFLGVKHVVGLNSGTDALLLALAAAGVSPGDEVITVSHTFIATIQVIHHLGATPVLVDVGEDGLMHTQRAISAITKKTKAIIPVHLSGDMASAIFLSEHSGVPVIEDAAQAIGAERNGRKAGTIGLAGCFSFYPAKVLGTFGDAGALVTNDSEVAERVRRLRNHGGVTKEKYPYYEFGWNSRLDNVWAAVLTEKLKRLPADLKRRETIAQRYLVAFQDLPVGLPVNRPGRIWQDFVLRIKHPLKLAKYLKERGIGTLGTGMLPNHKHPGLGLEHFSLPVTEALVRESIRIPCNQFLTDEEVTYVIETTRAFYA